MSYWPIASTIPTAARSSVIAPPSARSRSTEPVIGESWPGCRRAVS